MTAPRSSFPPYSAELPTPAPRRGSSAAGGLGGVVARHARELHALIRRRLLIASVVFLGFFGLLPLGSLARSFAPDVPPGVSIVLLMQSGIAVVIAVMALFIWKRPPARIRHLRAVELAIFGIVTAYLVVSNSYFIHRFGLMVPPIESVRHPLLSIGATRLDGVTLRWLVVIIGYGTVIPNTWRRAATIVLAMSGIHLLQLIIQAQFYGVNPRELFSLLLYPIVWLTIGTVIAVFGSYRVSLLERRVQEAERLGQYRLKKFLGAGGMGDVYLAEHVLLNQPFAIKLLRPERILDDGIQRRFEAEVQAMARLQHWNTVEIYDYGHAADGSFYYVMEYLPGLSLEQIVAQYGPMPSGRAIRMLLQICNALQEAHAMGVTHRDIKPGNVLVTERAGIYDVAKLVDFGLVKHVGDNDSHITQDGMIAGTPAFMSPEQASGSPFADPRSDIYSLGAVGYFLLTGRPPFAHRTATQTLAAHIYETPIPVAELRPEVDPALDEVIRKCLSKEPSHRFADADSVANALRDCESFGTWSQADAIAWWRGVAQSVAQPA